MYCSTCGARVPEGRSRCDTCGSPLSRPSGYGVPATASAGPVAVVAACPRCGYQGPSATYFSQGGPLTALLLITLFTLPFMGVGGLVYYLMRHDYRACPRCGESWGRRAERALALGPGSAGVPVHPAVVAAEGEDVENPRGWMFGAYVMFAFAFILMMIGISGEAVPFLLGMASAGGGVAMVKGANRAREQRRQALLIGLQQPVLRLAEERGGRLTVTEVASTLGWPMPRAEKVLNSLEDGLRIASEVTDDGVIVYEFRELVHAPRLSPAEMDTLLGDGGGGTMRA